MTLNTGKLEADFLAGESEAVREIERWVRRAAGSYQARFGPDWEDVVQDSLLELTLDLRKKRFRGEGSFQGYVWRLVNHACIDRLRSRRPRQWVHLEALELPARDPSPFRRAAEQQAVRGLLQIFNSLPESCRELLRGIVEGKSYQEMSAETGVTAGTLRVRALRCRQKAILQREKEQPS